MKKKIKLSQLSKEFPSQEFTRFNTVQKDDSKTNQISSNIKFHSKFYLQNMGTKVNRQQIKESEIPISVLYNETINHYKLTEKRKNGDPKPIVFTLKEEQNTTNHIIRFEILGEDSVFSLKHKEENIKSDSLKDEVDKLFFGSRTKTSISEVSSNPSPTNM